MAKYESRDHDKTGTRLPILIPGTEKDQVGRAHFLEGKQQVQFVRRFTGDYLREGTVHNRELKNELAKTGEGTRLHAMIARRAVAESGNDPDTLKRFVHQEVRRKQRTEDVFKKWMPLSFSVPLRSAASRTAPLVAVDLKHSGGVPLDKAKSFPPPDLNLNDALQFIFAAEKSRNPQREARYGLAPLWTKEMSSAQLVLWWAESFDGQPYRRFMPAIFCPDFKTALYVWEALGERTGRICLGCGEFFVPERSNQLYHANGRCGDRHRHRRQRENEKKSKRGKGK